MMATPEYRSSRRSGEPIHPFPLPPDLAAFLNDQDLVALFHASNIGTLLVVKAPAREIVSLRGTFPIGVEQQLWDHPQSPVLRTLVTFHDQPANPLRVETFTNLADPDQATTFAALATQDELAILGYDERLRHRLSKRLANSTADQLPALLAAAQHLLADIPDDRRDFDAAKAAVMEVTRL